MKIKTTKDRRTRIGLRQRKRINGTAERPRLRIYRSVSHIYAQVIDDLAGTTVASTNANLGSGTLVFAGGSLLLNPGFGTMGRLPVVTQSAPASMRL